MITEIGAFVFIRWSIMIHVEVVQATGTASSDLNIWPQGAT